MTPARGMASGRTISPMKLRIGGPEVDSPLGNWCRLSPLATEEEKGRGRLVKMIEHSPCQALT